MTDAMTDSPEVTNEFLAYLLAQAHPSVRTWRGPSLAADIQAPLADYVGRLSDEAAAKDAASQVPSVTVPSPAFKPRLVALDGHRMLAHIEFTSPTAECPFVRIRTASTAPGSMDDPGIFRRLAAEFDAFRPQAILFYHPAHLPFRAPPTRIDQHLLAGQAGVMAARGRAPGLSRVVLRPAADLDCYPRYVAAYERIYVERPQLRDEVRTETKENLDECREQGLLFEVLVDDAWAGIVAAKREAIAGVTGIFMVDIVLVPEARSQGLGPAIHQRLAGIVAADAPATVLFGTISPLNTPSLKTATRAGRIEVGAFHWLEV